MATGGIYIVSADIATLSVPSNAVIEAHEGMRDEFDIAECYLDVAFRTRHGGGATCAKNWPSQT